MQQVKTIPRFTDITGMRFNMLTAKGRVLRVSASGHRQFKWVCVCDCGKTTEVSYAKLKSAHTKSCGCLVNNTEKMYTHKMSKSKEYQVWYAMISRCDNPNNKRFARYGGRGISYDPRWRKFENFISDMGIPERDKFKPTLDRVDNEGDYTKENCRWTDYTTQARNTSINVVIAFNGISKPLCQWALEIGITGCSLQKRIKKWGLDRALTEPKNHGFDRAKKRNKNA